MPFSFHSLELPGLCLIEARIFEDSRGSFMETYKRSEFVKNGISEEFLQDNFSRSKHGTLRGLHYQVDPKAQGKLVLVTQGEIYDVAVDLRPESPTFLRWLGVNLSSEDMKMLYLPAGFAHGFCVLSEEADVIYKVTSEFSPEHERGVAWNDETIGVRWPIEAPLLSERDAALPAWTQVSSRT